MDQNENKTVEQRKEQVAQMKSSLNAFNVIFDNPGATIKKISMICFWIVTICSIISAFKFGWNKTYHSSWYTSGYYTYDFQPIIFFSLFIGVPVITYISTLFLVAFGEMVENVKKLTEK